TQALRQRANGATYGLSGSTVNGRKRGLSPLVRLVGWDRQAGADFHIGNVRRYQLALVLSAHVRGEFRALVFWTCGGGPKSHCVVSAGGREEPPVGGECHSVDLAEVAREQLEQGCLCWRPTTSRCAHIYGGQALPLELKAAART